MNTTFLSMVMVATAVLGGPADSPTSKTGYTFIKEEKSIYLSSRELTLPDKRTTREIKAELVVNADAAIVLKVITNEQYAKSWMQSVKEFSTLRRINENDWLAYVQYEVPWPLSDQDCIIRYRCLKSENGKKYVLSLNSSPDYIPVKPGVQRISHLCGSWTITGEGSNGCRVIYTIYSEEKPKYPRWATDPIIQNNLINTMSSMKHLSENIR